VSKPARKRKSQHPTSDLGTPERANHGGISLEPVDRDLRGNVRQMRAHVRVECVLDAYWTRCQIIDRQREAGLRFRDLWERSTTVPRVTARYDERTPAGGSADATARIQDAKERLASALRQMPAQEAMVTIAVCGHNEWAGGTRRLEALRRGLTSLADYWRIEMAARTAC